MHCLCSLFCVFWSVAGRQYANRRKIIEVAFHKGIGNFPVLCFHFLLLFQINACKSHCLWFCRVLAMVYHVWHHSVFGFYYLSGVFFCLLNRGHWTNSKTECHWEECFVIYKIIWEHHVFILYFEVSHSLVSWIKSLHLLYCWGVCAYHPFICCFCLPLALAFMNYSGTNVKLLLHEVPL